MIAWACVWRLKVERRVSHRATAKQKVHARVSGATIQLTLLDLSVSGCKARCKSSAIEQGAPVTLVLSDNESIPGEVVWFDAGVAGIRFDRELSLESFLRLVQRGVAEMRDDAALRDAFGRRLPELSSKKKVVKVEPSDRRREPRSELRCDATVRLGYQRDLKVKIYNLSANGCLLRHRIEQLAIEDRIGVTLPEFESFSGTVVWNSGHKAGVRFDRPLHAAVLELIVARQRQDQGGKTTRDASGNGQARLAC